MTDEPKAEQEEREIVGSVEQVIFFAQRDAYGVYRLTETQSLEEVVLVARGRELQAGLKVQASGRWVEHPQHGRQFDARSVQEVEPQTAEALLRRLCLYPGIGEKSAQRVVDTLGLEALAILDREPQRWLAVEGVGPRTLESILAYHATRIGPLAQLEDRLWQAHLPRSLAQRLQRHYGNEAMAMLEHHPYRIAREVKGIGFATVDRLARSLGTEADDPERVQAGIMDSLYRARMDGHCALSRDELLAKAGYVLQLPREQVITGVDRLLQDEELLPLPQADPVLYFEQELWSLEDQVAKALHELAQVDHEAWSDGVVPEYLSEGQAEVLFAIARHGMVVMTGGPGTGKSTVVREVMNWALANEQEVHLAAPTGRAAKRLEQATGHKAQTLHRLLEIQPDSGSFRYGESQRLPEGLLVVDEASMLDLKLTAALLSALGPEHRLLLVGDVDQLPSVGAGNVLFDILRSADEGQLSVPVVRLSQIFRQAEGSSIVQNAHRVLRGELPQGDHGPGGEFFVVRSPSAQRVHEMVLQMVLERIPQVYGLDPTADVQVLCPMHRGSAGISAFNDALSMALTHEAPSLLLSSAREKQPRRYAVGDRVMQTKNDYERNVFNGDVGIVEHVDALSKSLVVDMEGVRVHYESDHLNSLRLAYAVSIHKSQGSEFPAVVIPLVQEHRLMLRRNLIYTAITRAVRLCILVGDSGAIERAVQHAPANARFTGLNPRLAQLATLVTL